MSDVHLHEAPEVANADLDALLSSFGDLPTIPEVLARIWQLVDDPRSSAADLERIVSFEPPLAAKVLRLANSPYYGGRGRVQNVRQAITALGFDTLRNLAVCLSVASGLAAKGSANGILDRRELWRHSVATAACARRIAREVGLEDSEDIFTAGLLHDIGMFVVALGRPEAYAEVVRIGLQEGIHQVDAERVVLGFDHAEVGSAFARRWHFPSALRAMIAEHHCAVDGERAEAKHVLRLADAVADRILPTQVLPEFECRDIEASDLLALDLDDEKLEGLMEVATVDVDQAQEFMNLV